MNEYKDHCDSCQETKDEMFARIYPIRRKNEGWKFICSSCWDDYSKKY